MPQAYFLHANGFPGPTYRVLLDQLPEFNVRVPFQLGDGTPAQLDRNFEHYVDWVVQDLEGARLGPVVGMGHSLGGVVTLMAAGRRPDLFSQVILMDPPFFSDWKRLIIHGARWLGLGDRLGPVQKSKVRRHRWASRAEAREYFLRKPFFQRFHSQAFQDYVEHGLTEHPEGGVTLALDREMESEIFRTLHPARPQGRQQVRGTLLYGADSDLVWKSDRRWWKLYLGHLDHVEVPGGHLFPLESPEKTAHYIRQAYQTHR